MDLPSRNFWWLSLLALASGCGDGGQKQVLEPVVAGGVAGAPAVVTPPSEFPATTPITCRHGGFCRRLEMRDGLSAECIAVVPPPLAPDTRLRCELIWRAHRAPGASLCDPAFATPLDLDPASEMTETCSIRQQPEKDDSPQLGDGFYYEQGAQAFPPCPMFQGRIQYTQHARATLLEWNAMAWLDCEG